MPWFVAKRPIVQRGETTEQYEYRVVSEEEIESIEPDWDWASSAFDTREEAQNLVDDEFWNGLE